MATFNTSIRKQDIEGHLDAIIAALGDVSQDDLVSIEISGPGITVVGFDRTEDGGFPRRPEGSLLDAYHVEIPFVYDETKEV